MMAELVPVLLALWLMLWKVTPLPPMVVLAMLTALPVAMVPLKVREIVPPLTKNESPELLEIAPVPKFDVPVTFVRETPFVPPEELMAEKFAFKARPLAMMAGAACVVLLTVPVLFVTL